MSKIKLRYSVEDLLNWLDTWVNACDYIGDIKRCEKNGGSCSEAKKIIRLLIIKAYEKKNDKRNS